MMISRMKNSARRYLGWFVDNRQRTTTLDLVETFPSFAPNSAGKYKDRAKLTVQTINQTVPQLAFLVESIGKQRVKLTLVDEFMINAADKQAAEELKIYFDKYGSDKANQHGYHKVYGPILKNRNKIKAIFEVGIGSNEANIVSNMGGMCQPGASLRAFRDFLPKATVYGADIDNNILIEEERIKTFFVDQTEPAAFTRLDSLIPSNLDLVIDDGLHAPNANIATLNFALTKIKVGGWVVVEDICLEARSLWEVVAAILSDRYQPYLLTDKKALVFAVKRVK